jgi:hypothetical protein
VIETRERELLAAAATLALVMRTQPPTAVGADSGADEPQRPPDYDVMVGELRRLMQELLPEHTEVLVVSRGDDRLVTVDGLRARHFPADAVGRWAGHHPALGAAADLLHAQRGAAEVVVVPATSSWWFETYPEFRELLARGHLLVDAPAIGYIWRLPTASPHGDAAVSHRAEAVEHATAMRHLRELVAALVDPDEVVAVISRGDPAFVDGLPVRARHFPGDVEGAYLGHPRDDRHALSLLDAAMSYGVTWLAIPTDATWWADHYPRLWARAHRAPSLVTHRTGVGTLVRLEPAS